MLDSFPQDAEAPATRYLLGEVLFESGRFAEAAREYERTAYDYPLHAKSAAAGYAALIAYQKHEPTLTGESKALWHRQGIESSLMFATSFPEHPESARVLTKSDEELFALNEFDRVIEVSKQILERNPPVERGYQRTAATLLAHSLFDRRRYVEAEAAYVRAQTYLAAERSGSPGDRGAHRGVDLQAGRSEADGRRCHRRGRRLPARRRCSRRTAKVRANAEFDAASILIVRTSSGIAQRKCSKSFRRKYPNHELAPEVTRTSGGRLPRNWAARTQAAGEFERIAARAEETAEVRRAALWQAAELYEKSASPTNAARLYASYVQAVPDRRSIRRWMRARSSQTWRRRRTTTRLARSGTRTSFAPTPWQAPRAPIAASTWLRRRRSKASSRRSRCSMRSSWSRRSTSRSSRSARRWRRC